MKTKKYVVAIELRTQDIDGNVIDQEEQKQLVISTIGSLWNVASVGFMSETRYIIQREAGGMPGDPEIFDNEKEAQQRYIDIVNEIFKVELITVEEAEEMMSRGWDYEGVRLYEVEV